MAGAFGQLATPYYKRASHAEAGALLMFTSLAFQDGNSSQLRSTPWRAPTALLAAASILALVFGFGGGFGAGKWQLGQRLQYLFQHKRTTLRLQCC